MTEQTPKLRDRNKRATLAAILDRADAYEQRLLADLKTAGYGFRSVAEARRHFQALRAVERFSSDGDETRFAAELERDPRALAAAIAEMTTERSKK